MSLIYLAALMAVAAAILTLTFEAVVCVSRRPDWRVATIRLALVETVDRRTQELPFVGLDRRDAARAAQATANEHKTG